MKTIQNFPTTGTAGTAEAATPKAPIERQPHQVTFLRPLNVLVLAAALGLSASAPQPVESQWGGVGHGKRYLRINEYLFNGVQKVTAIAQHLQADTKLNAQV